VPPGQGTVDQGNDGGAGTTDNQGTSGGGGGAGSAGSAGQGGDGVYYGNIFGDSYGDNGWFASGGAGKSVDGTTYAAKQGGGGASRDGDPSTADAMPNTGGGGGAAGANEDEGGDGGSGIVLVRYKDPESVNVYTVVNSDNSTPPQFRGQQVFTSDGTFTVPDGITQVDVLIVAGGGGGGGSAGGGASGAGGGAGGVVYKEDVSVTPQSDYNITVGAGGGSTGSSSDLQGSNGGNSSAFGFTALGGGGGGSRDVGDATGKDGGSGGGAGSQATGVQGAGLQPGSASGGFGNDGGDSGFSGGDNASGGGGGAGGIGGTGQDNAYSGDGGIGRYFGHVFGDGYGENGWFAGGGGGGNPGGDRVAGAGGKGGGADGGSNDAADAMANTGGGGGGAGSSGAPSDGGSGIVIVKWGNDAENGNEIPGINKGDDLSGKYLWVMQELITNNPDFSPSMKSLDVQIKGEAVVAGKGKDAYQLSIHDGQLKGNINNQEISSSSLSNDAYQHVAITYDGSDQEIYINGLLTGTSSLGGNINTNTSNFLMGYNIEGILDEVRLSDTSRTQAWLKAEYHNGNFSLLTIGGEGALSNAAVGNVTYPAVGSTGPLRVGFGSTASSSRTAAGSSYWGIPGLTGNVWERTVSVGNTEGRSFSGVHGDGQLNASGLFDVTNWDINGLGFRGGAFKHNISDGYFRISDRTAADHNNEARGDSWGGRGARTAE
jgi:hypothetical protein